MKVTAFTSNQPRHLSLIAGLAGIADEVFAVQECNTIFPGRVADFFQKSDTMRDYFSRVIAAEQQVFGDIGFSPANVRSFSIKTGDLNGVDAAILAPALQSDVYVVFGASYIKPPLVDLLVERGAINIHMGVSPYYRGSSCNFWSIHDGNPDLVGATIHRLSRGLDSGAMLFHVLPSPEPVDPFLLGMKAVAAAHARLVESIQTGEIRTLEPVIQEKSLEIRYTRNADFDDDVARQYLARQLDAAWIGERLARHPDRTLVRARYGV